MNKFCISIKYFIELFVVIMIFVMFLHRCIVLYFRKNRFAAPMMLCINIFLVGILFSIKSICTRYNILFLACASGFFRHIVLVFFYIINSLRWLPWQMQHQRFKRFGLLCIDFYYYFYYYYHYSDYS